MSLSSKGALSNEKRPSITGKITTLNPNAAEFVPFSLRSSPGSTGAANVSSRFAFTGNETPGEAVLDRSESFVSNNSDEEAHNYWRCQLPDDITPDFNVIGEDESHGANSLSFSSLTLQDGNQMSRFSASAVSGLMLNEQRDLSFHPNSGNVFPEKAKYTFSSHIEDPSSSSFLHLPTTPWTKEITNNNQVLHSVREGNTFDGNASQSFLSNMVNEQALAESTDMTLLDLLASQFSGFATESLAEVYFASGNDLNLTIEMLTQLELQVDGDSTQSLNSKALSAPNLSVLDFPALSVPDGHSGPPKFAGDDLQQCSRLHQYSDQDNMLLYKSNSSVPSSGARDFPSVVGKMGYLDSGTWKYDRNSSADASVGSSRSSHVFASSYSSGQGRDVYSDKLQGRGSAWAPPVWLETGEAVANMYAEGREEARDHARLQNVYFEQARQAYLIGNKALAKELSVKGQLHSMHMKAAHGKAQESIYRLRNPRPVSSSMEMQGRGGQERIIDLHGLLHASEAVHVLKRELNLLRNAARSADHPVQVYICVGTGGRGGGSRAPTTRLLHIAVQRYLLEEEGLDYTEPQPGLIRVVIY